MAFREILLPERRGFSLLLGAEKQELRKYHSGESKLDYITAIIRLPERSSASLLPPPGVAWPLSCIAPGGNPLQGREI
jgi:hypothetical protein